MNDLAGWTILAASLGAFGIYSIAIFVLGIIFAGRFQVEVTDGRDHEDQ